MNDTEKDILAMLRQDARLSHSDIAKTLGLKTADVDKIVKSLEDRGVILGYTTLIDDSAINSDCVEALIEVKVNPIYGRGFEAIAEDVYKFDEVKSLYLMSGGYDLAVFIEGKNLREVASFVSEKLSVMDKVLSTATHFILKKYKIGGQMTVGAECGRQPIAP